MRVCQDLHNEAWEILYHENTLVLDYKEAELVRGSNGLYGCIRSNALQLNLASSRVGELGRKWDLYNRQLFDRFKNFTLVIPKWRDGFDIEVEYPTLRAAISGIALFTPGKRLKIRLPSLRESHPEPNDVNWLLKVFQLIRCEKFEVTFFYGAIKAENRPVLATVKGIVEGTSKVEDLQRLRDQLEEYLDILEGFDDEAYFRASYSRLLRTCKRLNTAVADFDRDTFIAERTEFLAIFDRAMAMRRRDVFALDDEVLG